jgi:hypothetical protein
VHWEYSLESQTEQSVSLRYRCNCGAIERTMDLPMEEFITLAREALD